MNGKAVTSKHQLGLSFGRIELHNGVLGNLECKTFISSQVWNEGTERGVEETNGYGTSKCASALPCEVTNERGVKKEGIFLSAEGPPDLATGKARRNGNTSLPWLGELTEKQNAKKEGRDFILMHDVKLWEVIPLGTEMGGEGVGPECGPLGGQEIPFEDMEGASEKAAGDELEPLYVNGTKNGLTPSHVKFEGEKTETEKSAGEGAPPETGKLESSKVGAAYLTGSLFAAGANFELMLVK
jgi:hypothetical protein